jgi:hypothetical protein
MCGGGVATVGFDEINNRPHIDEMDDAGLAMKPFPSL